MPSSTPTYLDLAASLDRRLLRNIQVPVKSVTGPGNYSLTYLDNVVLASAAVGSLTLTLPSAVGIAGMIFQIKKVDLTSNAIVINAQPGQYIDNSSSISMQDPMESRIIVSDGSRWQILADFDSISWGGGGIGFIIGQATQPLDQGVTGGSIIDVPGCAVTFSLAQTTDVLIIGSCAGIRAQDNPGWITELYVKVDASPDERMVFQELGVSDADVNSNGPGSFAIVKTLQAGPHTIKLRYYASGSNAVIHGPIRLIVIGAAPPPPSTGDIFAATRVVSPVIGEGTDTTIQSAINNLPSEGGTIFIKQGTYNLSSSLVLPGNKNITFIGTGDQSTIINAPTGLPIFTVPFVQNTTNIFYFLHRIGLRGTSSGEYVIKDDQGSLIWLFREVEISGVDQIINGASLASSIFVDLCNISSKVLSSNPNFDVTLNANFSDIKFQPDQGVLGLISKGRINHCLFTQDPGTARSTLKMGSRNLVSSSEFNGYILDVDDYNNLDSLRLTKSTLRLLSDFNTVSDSIINNSNISGYDGIHVQGDFNTISGNTFQSVPVPILESPGVTGNVYTGNQGTDGSTFQGSATVEGSHTSEVNGTSQDLYVTVVEHENPRGLMAVATVKNVGASNTIIVREIAEDFFGVVDQKDSTVLPTTDIILSTQNAVGTARPPYKRYALGIRSAVSGQPSNYQVRFLGRTPTKTTP